MKCHEVDYHIIGHEMQVVEVDLDPNETVIAEAGAMNYFEDKLVINEGDYTLCYSICVDRLCEQRVDDQRPGTGSQRVVGQRIDWR